MERRVEKMNIWCEWKKIISCIGAVEIAIRQKLCAIIQQHSYNRRKISVSVAGKVNLP